MGSSLLLLRLLLEPILLDWCRARLRGSGTLKLHLLRLVRLQVVCEVGLLGRWRGLGKRELLDLALGVGGLDLRDLVVLELAEVQILDEVG